MKNILLIAFICFFGLLGACQSDSAEETDTNKIGKTALETSDEITEETDLSGNKKSDVEKFKKMVPSAKERDEVKEAYKSYKENILSSNGKAALKDINEGSIEYYNQLLEWVRTASKSEVLALDPVDQFMILSVRKRLPKGEVQKMTGKDLLIYTIDNEWTNKSTVAKTELGEIRKVNENRIRCSMAVGTMNTDTFIEFERSAPDEPWKADLVSLTRNVNDQFVRMAGDQEKTVNEVILKLIGQITNSDLAEDIWKPLN